MPCSDSSLERDDPLAGTAGFGERWFLIEIDGAWGAHAILQSRLEPELARALVTRIEAAGIRPLAIRRTARKADERRAQKYWRWAAVDARPGQESVRWGVVDDPHELLDVPLDGSTGELSAEPVICVCTHARHDQCCAVKGRPVVTALARQYPNETWECSHLGGDRFAATMVVFPHGLQYGRVRSELAVAVIHDYLNGVADPALLRGRTSLPNVAQAAVAFASSLAEDHRIEAFDFISQEKVGEHYEVKLEHRGSPLIVTIVETLSAPMLSTCSANRAVSVRQFDLHGITHQTG
jgi:hypothetical protein